MTVQIIQVFRQPRKLPTTRRSDQETATCSLGSMLDVATIVRQPSCTDKVPGSRRRGSGVLVFLRRRLDVFRRSYCELAGSSRS
jgi:hypothetical protein